MSITAEYRDGVFTPLQEVVESKPGEVYEVFSKGELKRLVANVAWLKGSERSFEFWENEDDAVYDRGGKNHDGFSSSIETHSEEKGAS